MKKRIAALLIVLCCITGAVAAPINVIVNGEAVSAPAVMINGTVMLPFRTIFNSLGVDDSRIKWNAGVKSIEARTADDRFIFLVVGNRAALINDRMANLPVAPYIKDGSTYVPVRFVSEALEATVKWDGNTKTVYITK